MKQGFTNKKIWQIILSSIHFWSRMGQSFFLEFCAHWYFSFMCLVKNLVNIQVFKSNFNRWCIIISRKPHLLLGYASAFTMMQCFQDNICNQFKLIKISSISIEWVVMDRWDTFLLIFFHQRSSVTVSFKLFRSNYFK